VAFAENVNQKWIESKEFSAQLAKLLIRIWINAFFKPNRTKDLYARYFTTLVERVNARPADMDSIKMPVDLMELLAPERERRLRMSHNMIGNALFQISSPIVGKQVKRTANAGIERSLITIATALRLYSLENKGKLPKSLDELKPDYLKSIPEDPYGKKGTPIRYSAERTRVWSIGSDAANEDGLSLDENSKVSIIKEQGSAEPTIHLRFAN